MKDMLTRCGHRSPEGRQCLKVAGHECPHDPPPLPKPRPLADRARDAAGNASGPTAALILELLGEVDALVGAAIEHHPAMDLAGCRLPEKWRAVIMSRPYGENTICMSTEAFGTHAEAVAAVRKAAGLDA